jgi:hypothetical protein
MALKKTALFEAQLKYKMHLLKMYTLVSLTYVPTCEAITTNKVSFTHHPTMLPHISLSTLCLTPPCLVAVLLHVAV